MNNPLVLLGGMGPQASLELHRLLIQKASLDAQSPDTYPNIIHASIAVPDFIADKSAVDRAVNVINTACLQLPLHSSAAIGMACNTAHLLLDRLPEIQLSGKFVSMVDAVCDNAQQSGAQTVGLLASPTTITSRLYHDRLEARGLRVITPPASRFDELAAIIRGVISGTPPRQLRHRLTVLGNQLVSRGADAVILGCTELPLVGIDGDITQFNSLDALASALITRHRACMVV